MSTLRGAAKALIDYETTGAPDFPEWDARFADLRSALESETREADPCEYAPGETVASVRVAVEVTRRTDDEGTISFDAPGFTTVRACVDCGVLMRGGPTRCLSCAAKLPRPSPRGTGTEAVERVCPACGETPSAARERWAKIAARPDFDPEGAPTPCDHAALRRGTGTEGGK